MKIIDDPRAPNPRRVRIFLAEKGIRIAFEKIELGKLEHRAEPFRTLNPFMGVPTLVLDDGTAISESIAICRYFEALQPEPALFGRSPREQAEVEMWSRRVELNLYAAVANTFRHTHPAMAEREKPQVPTYGEACRTKAQELMQQLDDALAGRAFLAGEFFSVADITLLVTIDFMRLPKIERPPSLAHLDKWYGRVSTRPSASA